MRLLWEWIETHGIPCALYTDRKSVFVTGREPTIEEQPAGEEPRTAFGHTGAKLRIPIIPANSPQAKGRIEHNHGVYQDRFVKGLLLERIATIDGADKPIENGFIKHLNTTFVVRPYEARLSVACRMRAVDLWYSDYCHGQLGMSARDRGADYLP